MAGMAGAVLGWRADEFWSATPAELAAVIGFLAPESEAVGRGELERLMALYPDGAVFRDPGLDPG
nr:phage tail assembly chaperone [Allosphingosinicella vermicomposti]